MIEDLVFASGVTAPILALLVLGAILRRGGMLDAHFVARANALVFNVALPVTLFLAIGARSPVVEAALAPTAVGLVGTLLLVVMLLVAGRLLPPDQRGVFVQGAYRGNLAILGVALAVATYGEGVLPLVALYLGVVTTVYNVIAVRLLDAEGALGQIARNPIVLGIVAGLIAALADLPLPEVLERAGRYLADLTLPLALLCIGASIEPASLGAHRRAIALAALFKLVVSPALLVGLGIAAGLEGEPLGVLFFLAASPTATASYVMARRMTRHGALAAGIVAVTTVLGIASYTLGLALLRGAGLI